MPDESIVRHFLLCHFLCQLHLNKLSGRTRRTTIASQSETLGKQVELFSLHLNAAVFGQLIDNHQIFVTLRYREGDLQTETIGQRGHSLKRIAAMYIITFTIGKTFPNQMTAIGCCIQDQIVRLACQTALNKRFQRCKILIFSFKRQIIQALVLLWGVTSCHSPEELGSDIQREGINSITASFPNDDSSENSFKGEIDYTNHSITFVFPYNYPKLSDNVLPTSALKRVRLSASLANNVSVTPPLLYMDLTQDNYITVKDQTSGTSIEFKVIGEIRKSNECSITKFDIPAIGLLGVINENEKTISLVTIDNVGEQIANIDISHGATCNPNPETEALDYEQEQTIVVTAQNGIDKATYTVKKDIPQKTVAGIRQGSGKLLWSKRLSEISGILLPGKVTGLAVVDKYVVINERANDRAIYLNSQTGEIAGSMDISQFAGDNSNFHATADRGNNIF